MTVTAPGSGGRPPDVVEGAPEPGPRRRPLAVLALVGVVVLGVAAVRGGDGTAQDARPAPPAAPAVAAVAGITATASLSGAPTDRAYEQRLTLTVDLPAFDGRSDSGGRLLGDEVVLVDVQVRGFAVEPDDPRTLLPLGRFGRAHEVRSTTVPATAVVADCSIEPQARRDVDLTVRTGEGPDGTVRAVADADVVRALDRLVARTCRRPRG